MKLEWDLSFLYKDEDEYRKDLERCLSLIEKVPGYKGTLIDDVKLREYFDIDLELERLLNRLYSYAASIADLDRRVTEAVSRESRLINVARQLSSNASFFEPEVLSMGKERMDSFFNKNPEYRQYDFQIRKLFDSQEHVLSADKEKLISDFSSYSSAGRNLYSSLSVSDYVPGKCTLEDGREIQVSNSNWTTIIGEEKSAENRRRIFETLYSHFYKNRSTYASIYDVTLQEQLSTMKARNYSSILEEHLSGNKIPVEVYENLIESCHEGAQYLQKYYEIRRKYLGLEKHRSYDRFLSLAESRSRFTYEEARDIFLSSIKNYPEDYQKKALKAIEEGKVDVLPKDGKATGAYSRGGADLPPSILLNFNGTLEDVFTLAHEAGHSVHTLYAEESQPIKKQDYTIFVAEIASTFNEHNLLDYLLSSASLSKEDEIVLLQKAIDQICATFYRQTLFAEYELICSRMVEKGEPLDHETLSKVMQDLYSQYFGIDIKEEKYKDLVWCYIPHLFYSPFYVYQYATSFSASLSLYETYQKEGKEGFEKFASLLRMGGEDYPVSEVIKAGVDLTKKESFLAVVHRMKELVEKLGKVLS